MSMTCLINESPSTLSPMNKTEKITTVRLVAFLFLLSVPASNSSMKPFGSSSSTFLCSVVLPLKKKNASNYNKNLENLHIYGQACKSKHSETTHEKTRTLNEHSTFLHNTSFFNALANASFPKKLSLTFQTFVISSHIGS